MIASLAPLFCGPLAEHAEKLQLADPQAPALAGSLLFKPSYFAEFIGTLAERHATGDLLALTSIWSKWYFSSFMASTLAANLLLQRSLPIALDDIGVVLSTQDRPLGLRLPNDGSALLPCPPFERLRTLIEAHLEPAIEVFAEVSRASPRLFWSNAGNTFEFVTSRLELHPLASADCTAPARAVLNSRLRPDGRRNPLFAPVHYRDIGTDEPQRLRRICCIRYRLPGIGYCSSCPLDRDKQPD
ncbi:ferric iron reductase protein FhuF [Pseudomonas cuatrocienegasensis]|uniref:Ferric iron reductase protein FhuF n=1 Tax=Pseudomonas cuatrocienegasensis TaxID=543360 RepID=A0ABY1BPG9_9PSED|nr:MULTISPECIES: siderophore-iron reductase FhuF [Pseudomonas]OEC33741.1 siderophore-iron reductase FhuF [Pseudomonas sp. 21C1]SER31418.1 ferric iron reductase protein FhuF [Pseudomonas cuatrocienegasensis]